MADVKLYHPDADSKRQISVSEETRGIYESQGWVEVGTSSDDDKK